MEKKDLRIVFMGTPEFAVGSLQRLVENGYNVVAVVTQPDKPVGRHGSVLRPSPVKEYALAHNLPVLQPVKMKDEQFLEELRSYNADLQVVVAFRMLPEVVWAMPRFGTFNVHAALLPDYRGAAPINWAVINRRNHILPRPRHRHRSYHRAARVPDTRRRRCGVCIRRTYAAWRNALHRHRRPRALYRRRCAFAAPAGERGSPCRSEDIQGYLRHRLLAFCKAHLRLRARSVASARRMVYAHSARR